MTNVVLDGKTGSDGDDGHGARHLDDGRAHGSMGFVETDMKNAQVLTLFLRSLLERRLDVSQGMLSDSQRRQGAPGDRSEGLSVAVPWSNV